MERRKTVTRYDTQSKERLNYIVNEFCDGSQQELSRRTGVRKASISQYVNGKNRPSNLTALALCTPFDINPAWLLGFDVPMMCNDVPSTSDISLTHGEEGLILEYRSLNIKGKEKVIEYIQDLLGSSRYKR